MATLDDILTTQKNGVIAINNVNQTLSNIVSGINNYTNKISYLNGTTTTTVITTDTLVLSGSGRLVSFSIIVGGADGAIHDAASIITSAAFNVLAVTKNTIGIYQVGMQFTYGLVVKPGAGQSVAITYSVN